MYNAFARITTKINS